MRRELVVITYSERGAETAERLIQSLRVEGFACQGYLYEKYKAEGFLSFGKADSLVQDAFEKKGGLVFVCAAGIAVRLISPFVQSKETDSPVVVVDETGQFAIPILSGHLGGANELAGLCALATGGMPVITTATDVHQRFAVDDYARKYDMAVGDLYRAKKISVEILAGHTVEVCVRRQNRFCDECGEKKDMSQIWDRQTFYPGKASGEQDNDQEEAFLMGDRQLPFVEEFSGQNAGILISPFCEEIPDQVTVLQLIPRRFILGIGCRRGVESDRLQAVVQEVLQEQALDQRSLIKITTIDRKRDEEAILALADGWKIPLETFSAEVLAAQEGEFTCSEFVRGVTGVDNVCERSVIAGGGRRIIIPKHVGEGITVAVGVI